MITIVVCLCVHFYNHDIFIDFAQTKFDDERKNFEVLLSLFVSGDHFMASSEGEEIELWKVEMKFRPALNI